MSEQSPKSWFDRVIGACMSVLLASFALWCAVQVVQSILPLLIIAVGVIVLLWGGWAIFHVIRDRFF